MLHIGWNNLEVGLSGYMKRKDPPLRAGLSFHGIRQRPTLPGDFACLNSAQRAAVKILSKYNAAHWLGQSEK